MSDEDPQYADRNPHPSMGRRNTQLGSTIFSRREVLTIMMVVSIGLESDSRVGDSSHRRCMLNPHAAITSRASWTENIQADHHKKD